MSKLAHNSQHTARITCLGRDDDVARIRTEIASRLRELRYQSLDVSLIQAAVGKLVRMLIRDANASDSMLPLQVIYAVSDHGTWIRVEAYGSPLCLPLEAAPLRREREIGVLKMLVDRVYFNADRNTAMLEFVRRK